MRQKVPPFFYLHVLAMSTLLISCARSFNPDIQRGSSMEYQQGYPEVRLSTIGLLDDNNIPMINVTADVVYSSLIFKSKDDKYRSEILVEIQIKPQDENKPPVTQQFTEIISDDDPSVQNLQSVFTINRNIKVDPGHYTILLSITDQYSGKTSNRESYAYIPNPKEKITALTDIQLSGKDLEQPDSDWVPITTYDLPGRLDSLKFVFQVTNNKLDAPLTIIATLSKFNSDSSAANPLHYTNLTMSNIKNRGIEYDEHQTIQTTQRIIDQPGSVLIEFAFPQQQYGNYRFYVQAKNDRGDELFKAREFGIKSENYPSLKTPHELAEPLVYLMDDKEYKNLMTISDPDSIKEQIDRFWLRHVGNMHKARNVIKLYYERVEEANKQFSNFKEGWKTDMGMIYILFGPPWYIDKRMDEMQWFYTYDRWDSNYNFHFKRSKLKSEFYPFDNYVVHRDQRYFTLQYQQKSLWLNGYILSRQL